jgi:hypothetical protein
VTRQFASTGKVEHFRTAMAADAYEVWSGPISHAAMLTAVLDTGRQRIGDAISRIWVLPTSSSESPWLQAAKNLPFTSPRYDDRPCR